MLISFFLSFFRSSWVNSRQNRWVFLDSRNKNMQKQRWFSIYNNNSDWFYIFMLYGILQHRPGSFSCEIVHLLINLHVLHVLSQRKQVIETLPYVSVPGGSFLFLPENIPRKRHMQNLQANSVSIPQGLILAGCGHESFKIKPPQWWNQTPIYVFLIQSIKDFPISLWISQWQHTHLHSLF